MKIQKNVKLAPYTTYKIGGLARYFVAVKTEDDIREALGWAKEKKVSYFILGGGSNLLISDEGYDGLVISIQNHRRVGSSYGNNRSSYGRVILEVSSGALMRELVEETTNSGLIGLEWAGGLPGQLGGAIRGNASCFGGQIEDIIKNVKAMDPYGNIKIFNKNQCKFKNKTSIFKEKPELIILSAEIKFKKGDRAKLQEKVNYCLKWRKENQPIEFGTCGSVFTRKLLNELPKDFFDKHPDTQIAIKGINKQRFRELGTAYLIDYGLGLKGLRVGDAEISHKHANFIVNIGNARAEDVIILLSIVKSRVLNKYGILLEEEVYYLS